MPMAAFRQAGDRHEKWRFAATGGVRVARIQRAIPRKCRQIFASRQTAEKQFEKACAKKEAAGHLGLTGSFSDTNTHATMEKTDSRQPGMSVAQLCLK